MRVVIVGNSGAGKSTLAQRLAAEHGLAHLDLDTVAWAEPAVRAPLEASCAQLDAFFAEHDAWVLEGCYADLAQHALTRCTELVFLDPGLDACLAHNAARPGSRTSTPARRPKTPTWPCSRTGSAATTSATTPSRTAPTRPCSRASPGRSAG